MKWRERTGIDLWVPESSVRSILHVLFWGQAEVFYGVIVARPDEPVRTGVTPLYHITLMYNYLVASRRIAGYRNVL